MAGLPTGGGVGGRDERKPLAQLIRHPLSPRPENGDGNDKITSVILTSSVASPAGLLLRGRERKTHTVRLRGISTWWVKTNPPIHTNIRQGGLLNNTCESQRCAPRCPCEAPQPSETKGRRKRPEHNAWFTTATATAIDKSVAPPPPRL